MTLVDLELDDPTVLLHQRDLYNKAHDYRAKLPAQMVHLLPLIRMYVDLSRDMIQLMMLSLFCFRFALDLSDVAVAAAALAADVVAAAEIVRCLLPSYLLVLNRLLRQEKVARSHGFLFSRVEEVQRHWRSLLAEVEEVASSAGTQNDMSTVKNEESFKRETQ